MKSVEDWYFFGSQIFLRSAVDLCLGNFLNDVYLIRIEKLTVKGSRTSVCLFYFQLVNFAVNFKFASFWFTEQFVKDAFSG